MTDDVPTERWWVYIDDQYAKDGPNLIGVGPYPTKEAAEHAGNNAAIIDSILQDGGVECWWDDREPSEMVGKPPFSNAPAYTLETWDADLADEDYTG